MEERSEELWHEKARQLGIVVIIPTYNNEKTLTTVIEDVLFYVEDIIVVNDGSTDSTPTLLENYPNLHIITHPTNKGKRVDSGKHPSAVASAVHAKAAGRSTAAAAA